MISMFPWRLSTRVETYVYAGISIPLVQPSACFGSEVETVRESLYCFSSLWRSHPDLVEHCIYASRWLSRRRGSVDGQFENAGDAWDR